MSVRTPITLLLALALMACASAPSPEAAADEPPAAGGDMNKKPMPELTFTPGPELTPTDALVLWIEGLEGTPTLKLPVLIERSPLGVEAAHIGAPLEGEALPEDAVALSLNDTTMGIALATHLRDACPDQDTCAVWLVGYFGQALPMPTFEGEADDDARGFTVRRFVGPVAADAPRRVFIQE